MQRKKRPTHHRAAQEQFLEHLLDSIDSGTEMLAEHEGCTCDFCADSRAMVRVMQIFSEHLQTRIIPSRRLLQRQGVFAALGIQLPAQQ